MEHIFAPMESENAHRLNGNPALGAEPPDRQQHRLRAGIAIL
jgi:hypothetical protein